MSSNSVIGDIPILFGRGTVQVCRRNKMILLVALSRPNLFNAFNDDVYEDLISIMDMVQNDPSYSAIVLTGCGTYFSSGADLKNSNFMPEPNGRKTHEKPAGRFMLSIIRFNKIFAVAVNGPAVGIAVTLLLHCDIVHCSTKATLWAPFTRLALVPELCSSVTFIETHGLSKANELLLLGKRIDAQKAYDWNICSQVVPIDNVEAANDPFHTESLASLLCNDIHQRLLTLPLGNKSAEIFVKFIKGNRQKRLEHVCLEELKILDERFDTGQVAQAARHIKIGSSSNTTKKKKSPKQRSKL